jgi:hypothetical protein
VPHGQHAGANRKRRRKVRVTPVYIDGAAVSVLKHKELPPGFAPKMVMRGEPFPIYSLSAYLTRVGADMSKVSEVQLIGGNRPAIIGGEELRRTKDSLHFAFTRGDGGQPRMDWPAGRVKISTHIDRIVAIHVYQKDPPPRFDKKRRAFIDSRGQRIDGVPYAEHMRSLKGTRIYFDGRLLGALRRKDLDQAIRGDDTARGELSFYLTKYLRKLGAPKTPHSVEFVARDRIVGRLDGAAYRKLEGAMRFTLPKRSRGKMHIRMTREMSPFPGGVALSAILLYRAFEAPKRPVLAPRRRPSHPSEEAPVSNIPTAP